MNISPSVKRSLQSRLPAFARLRYPICASGDKSPSRLSTAALPRPPLFRHRRRSGSSPLRGSQGRTRSGRHAGGGRSPLSSYRTAAQRYVPAGDQDRPYGLCVRRRLVKTLCSALGCVSAATMRFAEVVGAILIAREVSLLLSRGNLKAGLPAALRSVWDSSSPAGVARFHVSAFGGGSSE